MRNPTAAAGLAYLEALGRNVHRAPLTPYYLLFRLALWLVLSVTRRLEAFEGGYR